MNEQTGSESRQFTPEANLAVVRRLYEAFARRDVPAILSALADDVIWSEPDNPLNPAGGTRHGHDGFLEWLRIGNANEDIVSLELRDLLITGNKVAAVGHTTCRVRTTGKLYETEFVHLVTLRNGLVTRFQEFFDTYAAAEAFRP